MDRETKAKLDALSDLVMKAIGYWILLGVAYFTIRMVAEMGK